MIYDKIDNAHHYFGIHPNLDDGLNFLMTANLNELSVGKIILNGEKVFVNIMDANLKSEDDISFEFHKKYLDIQLDIVGKEYLQIGLAEDRNSIVFDKKNDFGTVNCHSNMTVPLGENHFVICMPNEPHKPSIQVEKNTKIKKCVIKVLID